MKPLASFTVLLSCLALQLSAAPAERKLAKADVLPLALDGNYQFRKFKVFLNEPVTFTPTVSEPINYERRRMSFGQVTNVDAREAVGKYFTFFWRSSRTSDLTVRFEYQQAKLGPYVMAREIDYPRCKGSRESAFAIVGDDYKEAGPVTAWRALLIQGGKVVALTQSYLWD